jgi:hypothetical protein
MIFNNKQLCIAIILTALNGLLLLAIVKPHLDKNWPYAYEANCNCIEATDTAKRMMGSQYYKIKIKRNNFTMYSGTKKCYLIKTENGFEFGSLEKPKYSIKAVLED